MNLPSLPMDNLYKFQAVFGGFLAILFYGLIIYQINESQIASAHLSEVSSQKLELTAYLLKESESLTIQEKHQIELNLLKLKATVHSALSHKAGAEATRKNLLVAETLGALMLLGFATYGFYCWKTRQQIWQDIEVEHAAKESKMRVREIEVNISKIKAEIVKLESETKASRERKPFKPTR